MWRGRGSRTHDLRNKRQRSGPANVATVAGASLSWNSKKLGISDLSFALLFDITTDFDQKIRKSRGRERERERKRERERERRQID